MPSCGRFLAACACTLLLAGCAQDAHVAVPTNITELPDSEINLEQARAQNVNGFVSKDFEGHISVLTDATGVDAVRTFFPDSESLIIAEDSDAAALRAASLSVAQRVPMVTYAEDARTDIVALISELGVSRVVLIGDVPLASNTAGSLTVIKDNGGTRAMGEFTAFEFTSQVIADPQRMVAAVANLDSAKHIELKAAWQPLTRYEDIKRVEPLPAQSRRDAQMSPIVVATPTTPIAAVANAVAFGASVRVMPSGDPTASKAAYAMVAGLENGPLVALGSDFGDASLLSDRIGQGWHE